MGYNDDWGDGFWSNSFTNDPVVYFYAIEMAYNDFKIELAKEYAAEQDSTPWLIDSENPPQETQIIYDLSTDPSNYFSKFTIFEVLMRRDIHNVTLVSVPRNGIEYFSVKIVAETLEVSIGAETFSFFLPNYLTDDQFSISLAFTTNRCDFSVHSDYGSYSESVICPIYNNMLFHHKDIDFIAAPAGLLVIEAEVMNDAVSLDYIKTLASMYTMGGVEMAGTSSVWFDGDINSTIHYCFANEVTLEMFALLYVDNSYHDIFNTEINLAMTGLLSVDYGLHVLTSSSPVLTTSLSVSNCSHDMFSTDVIFSTDALLVAYGAYHIVTGSEAIVLSGWSQLECNNCVHELTSTRTLCLGFLLTVEGSIIQLTSTVVKLSGEGFLSPRNCTHSLASTTPFPVSDKTVLQKVFKSYLLFYGSEDVPLEAKYLIHKDENDIIFINSTHIKFAILKVDNCIHYCTSTNVGQWVDNSHMDVVSSDIGLDIYCYPRNASHSLNSGNVRLVDRITPHNCCMFITENTQALPNNSYIEIFDKYSRENSKYAFYK